MEKQELLKVSSVEPVCSHGKSSFFSKQFVINIFITVFALCMVFAIVFGWKLNNINYEVMLEECNAETGGDVELLKISLSSQKLGAVDKSLKCLLACIMRKRNMTDENGDLRLHTMQQDAIQSSNELMVNIVEKCSSLSIDDFH